MVCAMIIKIEILSLSAPSTILVTYGADSVLTIYLHNKWEFLWRIVVFLFDRYYEKVIEITKIIH